MPEDFDNLLKYCENCGQALKLKCNRDIQRKRFCSRSCMYEYVKPYTYVQPHSEVTREKMRQSKLNLLSTGWKPLGWRARQIVKRISGRGYYFVGTKREHQVMLEEQLAHKLALGEVVHHRDGNKLNNALHNLELMSRSEHAKLHVQWRLGNVPAGF